MGGGRAICPLTKYPGLLGEGWGWGREGGEGRGLSCGRISKGFG